MKKWIVGVIVTLGVLAGLAGAQMVAGDPVVANAIRIWTERYTTSPVFGTNDVDRLTGSGGPDVIVGYAENDRLNGGNGSDLIIGGDGDDYLIGGPGYDWIICGAGDDTVTGDAGFDLIDGGTGDDELVGYAGNDTILGGPGDDFINGGLAEDHLVGEAGDDFLWGRWGDDILEDGAGNDDVQGGSGNNIYILGPGNDRIIIDTNDTRDEGGHHEIHGFVRGEDIFRVPPQAKGIITRKLNDRGERFTEATVWSEFTPHATQTILVIGAWVNPSDSVKDL